MHDPEQATERYADDADNTVRFDEPGAPSVGFDRTVAFVQGQPPSGFDATVAVGPADRGPGAEATVAYAPPAGGRHPTVDIDPRDDPAGFTMPHQTGPSQLSGPSQFSGPSQSSGSGPSSGPSRSTGPYQPGYGESTGYAPPPPDSTGFPPRPAVPIALPQRVPAQFAPPPQDWNASATSRGIEAASNSIHIGDGVVPATPRRDLRPVTRRWWGYLTRVLSALATLILIAAAAWTGWQWWEHWHNKVSVGHVAVGATPVSKGTCDTEFDVTGTIATNGKAGNVTYEWLRSDGQNSGVLTESVAAGQKTTVVHLYWTFTGHGSVTARATLRVLTPNQVEQSAEFPYSCA